MSSIPTPNPNRMRTSFLDELNDIPPPTPLPNNLLNTTGTVGSGIPGPPPHQNYHYSSMNNTSFGAHHSSQLYGNRQHYHQSQNASMVVPDYANANPNPNAGGYVHQQHQQQSNAMKYGAYYPSSAYLSGDNSARSQIIPQYGNHSGMMYHQPSNTRFMPPPHPNNVLYDNINQHASYKLSPSGIMPPQGSHYQQNVSGQHMNNYSNPNYPSNNSGYAGQRYGNVHMGYQTTTSAPYPLEMPNNIPGAMPYYSAPNPQQMRNQMISSNVINHYTPSYSNNTMYNNKITPSISTQQMETGTHNLQGQIGSKTMTPASGFQYNNNSNINARSTMQTMSNTPTFNNNYVSAPHSFYHDSSSKSYSNNTQTHPKSNQYNMAQIPSHQTGSHSSTSYYSAPYGNDMNPVSNYTTRQFYPETNYAPQNQNDYSKDGRPIDNATGISSASHHMAPTHKNDNSIKVVTSDRVGQYHPFSGSNHQSVVYSLSNVSTLTVVSSPPNTTPFSNNQSTIKHFASTTASDNNQTTNNYLPYNTQTSSSFVIPSTIMATELDKNHFTSSASLLSVHDTYVGQAKSTEIALNTADQTFNIQDTLSCTTASGSNKVQSFKSMLFDADIDFNISAGSKSNNDKPITTHTMPVSTILAVTTCPDSTVIVTSDYHLGNFSTNSQFISTSEGITCTNIPTTSLNTREHDHDTVAVTERTCEINSQISNKASDSNDSSYDTTKIAIENVVKKAMLQQKPSLDYIASGSDPITIIQTNTLYTNNTCLTKTATPYNNSYSSAIGVNNLVTHYNSSNTVLSSSFLQYPPTLGQQQQEYQSGTLAYNSNPADVINAQTIYSNGYYVNQHQNATVGFTNTNNNNNIYYPGSFQGPLSAQQQAFMPTNSAFMDTSNFGVRPSMRPHNNMVGGDIMGSSSYMPGVVSHQYNNINNNRYNNSANIIMYPTPHLMGGSNIGSSTIGFNQTTDYSSLIDPAAFKQPLPYTPLNKPTPPIPSSIKASQYLSDTITNHDLTKSTNVSSSINHIALMNASIMNNSTIIDSATHNNNHIKNLPTDENTVTSTTLPIPMSSAGPKKRKKHQSLTTQDGNNTTPVKTANKPGRRKKNDDEKGKKGEKCNDMPKNETNHDAIIMNDNSTLEENMSQTILSTSMALETSTGETNLSKLKPDSDIDGQNTDNIVTTTDYLNDPLMESGDNCDMASLHDETDEMGKKAPKHRLYKLKTPIIVGKKRRRGGMRADPDKSIHIRSSGISIRRRKASCGNVITTDTEDVSCTGYDGDMSIKNISNRDGTDDEDYEVPIPRKPRNSQRDTALSIKTLNVMVDAPEQNSLLLETNDSLTTNEPDKTSINAAESIDEKSVKNEAIGNVPSESDLDYVEKRRSSRQIKRKTYAIDELDDEAFERELWYASMSKKGATTTSNGPKKGSTRTRQKQTADIQGSDPTSVDSVKKEISEENDAVSQRDPGDIKVINSTTTTASGKKGEGISKSKQAKLERERLIALEMARRDEDEDPLTELQNRREVEGFHYKPEMLSITTEFGRSAITLSKRILAQEEKRANRTNNYSTNTTVDDEILPTKLASLPLPPLALPYVWDETFALGGGYENLAVEKIFDSRLRTIVIEKSETKFVNKKSISLESKKDGNVDTKNLQDTNLEKPISEANVEIDSEKTLIAKENKVNSNESELSKSDDLPLHSNTAETITSKDLDTINTTKETTNQLKTDIQDNMEPAEKTPNSVIQNGESEMETVENGLNNLSDDNNKENETIAEKEYSTEKGVNSNIVITPTSVSINLNTQPINNLNAPETDNLMHIKTESIKTKLQETTKEIEEFYVKFKHFSYLHCLWLDEETLLRLDKRAATKIKRFRQKKHESTFLDSAYLDLNEELFNPDFLEVERVIAEDVFDISYFHNYLPANYYYHDESLEENNSKMSDDINGSPMNDINNEKHFDSSNKLSENCVDKPTTTDLENDVTSHQTTSDDKPKIKTDVNVSVEGGGIENALKHEKTNLDIEIPTDVHSPKLNTDITLIIPNHCDNLYVNKTNEEISTSPIINAVNTLETIVESSTTKFEQTIVEETKIVEGENTLSTTELNTDHKTTEEIKIDLINKIDTQNSKIDIPISMANNNNKAEKTPLFNTPSAAEPTEIKIYLVKWRALPYEEITWERECDVDQLKIAFYKRCQRIPRLSIKKIPRPDPVLWRKLDSDIEYKNGNKLREYQLEGVNWLSFCWYNRQNCILADEMGLGKTVQSITFLLEMFKAGVKGPYLILAPLSTIANWQREFELWSDLNVLVYHGSSASRQIVQEYEMYFRDNKGYRLADVYKFNAFITTYEILMQDCETLKNIWWRVSIIDEAHRLKNIKCKLMEGIKSLKIEHRVLLTGTPLQNNIEELWSLLNFLEPVKFESSTKFLAEYGTLDTEEQVTKLQELLRPMMLRRLKEDVEKSLAPKEETIIEVELTNIQKKYYRAILEKNLEYLSKGSTSNSNVPNLINIMMELRKCCIHPFLIKGAEDKILLEEGNTATETTDQVNAEERAAKLLINSSGKLVLIDKLLPKLKADGHKVLIFSQMVRCLDLLEDYLIHKRYTYERLDGRIRGDLRQAAIDRFCRKDSDRFVFLLCTRAGGLGINLTAADTCIIFDSDWNPQNDLQAQARCHRIGQRKRVQIYRLICRNTYEREMFDRAGKKLGLDKAVLQSMRMTAPEENNSTTDKSTSSQLSGLSTGNAGTGNPINQLSKAEIEDLLKKGAYGALMDDDNAGDKFCEEDIEQILSRRTQIVQLDPENAANLDSDSAGNGEKKTFSSTFAKASFTATGNRSDIDIDDPNFWQKWAEKADIDIDKALNKKKNQLIDLATANLLALDESDMLLQDEDGEYIDGSDNNTNNKRRMFQQRRSRRQTARYTANPYITSLMAENETETCNTSSSKENKGKNSDDFFYYPPEDEEGRKKNAKGKRITKKMLKNTAKALLLASKAAAEALDNKNPLAKLNAQDSIDDYGSSSLLGSESGFDEKHDTDYIKNNPSLTPRKKRKDISMETGVGTKTVGGKLKELTALLNDDQDGSDIVNDNMLLSDPEEGVGQDPYETETGHIHDNETDFTKMHWNRIQCYSAEKGIMTFGWGRWDEILQSEFNTIVSVPPDNMIVINDEINTLENNVINQTNEDTTIKDTTNESETSTIETSITAENQPDTIKSMEDNLDAIKVENVTENLEPDLVNLLNNKNMDDSNLAISITKQEEDSIEDSISQAVARVSSGNYMLPTTLCANNSSGVGVVVSAVGKKRRQMSTAKLEHLSRLILLHCLKHYHGDANIKSFMWELIMDPLIVCNEDMHNVVDMETGELNHRDQSLKTSTATPQKEIYLEIHQSNNKTDAISTVENESITDPEQISTIKSLGHNKFKNHSGLSAPVPRGRKGKKYFMAQSQACSKDKTLLVVSEENSHSVTMEDSSLINPIDESINSTVLNNHNSDGQNSIVNPYNTMGMNDETPKIYKIKMNKSALDSEILLGDVLYKKHLQRHANKIILRVRMLYYLKTEIIGDLGPSLLKPSLNPSLPPLSKIKIKLPPAFADPDLPTNYWNDLADKALLIGVYKHGYENYEQMRNDPYLSLESLQPNEKSVVLNNDTTAVKDIQTSEIPEKDDKNTENLNIDDKTTIESTKEENINQTITTNSINYQNGWPLITNNLTSRFRRLITAYQRAHKKLLIKNEKMNEKREKILREQERLLMLKNNLAFPPLESNSHDEHQTPSNMSLSKQEKNSLLETTTLKNKSLVGGDDITSAAQATPLLFKSLMTSTIKLSNTPNLMHQRNDNTLNTSSLNDKLTTCGKAHTLVDSDVLPTLFFLSPQFYGRAVERLETCYIQLNNNHNRKKKAHQDKRGILKDGTLITKLGHAWTIGERVEFVSVLMDTGVIVNREDSTLPPGLKSTLTTDKNTEKSEVLQKYESIYEWSMYRRFQGTAFCHKSDVCLEEFFIIFYAACIKSLSLTMSTVEENALQFGPEILPIPYTLAQKFLENIDLLNCVRVELLSHHALLDKAIISLPRNDTATSSINNPTKRRRNELPDPNNDETPYWWDSEIYDREMLIGVACHGLGNLTETLFSNPAFSFIQAIKSTSALVSENVAKKLNMMETTHDPSDIALQLDTTVILEDMIENICQQGEEERLVDNEPHRHSKQKKSNVDTTTHGYLFFKREELLKELKLRVEMESLKTLELNKLTEQLPQASVIINRLKAICNAVFGQGNWMRQDKCLEFVPTPALIAPTLLNKTKELLSGMEPIIGTTRRRRSRKDDVFGDKNKSLQSNNDGDSLIQQKRVSTPDSIPFGRTRSLRNQNKHPNKIVNEEIPGHVNNNNLSNQKMSSNNLSQEDEMQTLKQQLASNLASMPFLPPHLLGGDLGSFPPPFHLLPSETQKLMQQMFEKMGAPPFNASSFEHASFDDFKRIDNNTASKSNIKPQISSPLISTPGNNLVNKNSKVPVCESEATNESIRATPNTVETIDNTDTKLSNVRNESVEEKGDTNNIMQVLMLNAALMAAAASSVNSDENEMPFIPPLPPLNSLNPNEISALMEKIAEHHSLLLPPNVGRNLMQSNNKNNMENLFHNKDASMMASDPSLMEQFMKDVTAIQRESRMGKMNTTDKSVGPQHMMDQPSMQDFLAALGKLQCDKMAFPATKNMDKVESLLTDKFMNRLASGVIPPFPFLPKANNFGDSNTTLPFNPALFEMVNNSFDANLQNTAHKPSLPKNAKTNTKLHAESVSSFASNVSDEDYVPHQSKTTTGRDKKKNIADVSQSKLTSGFNRKKPKALVVDSVQNDNTNKLDRSFDTYKSENTKFKPNAPIRDDSDVTNEQQNDEEMIRRRLAFESMFHPFLNASKNAVNQNTPQSGNHGLPTSSLSNAMFDVASLPNTGCYPTFPFPPPFFPPSFLPNASSSSDGRMGDYLPPFPPPLSAFNSDGADDDYTNMINNLDANAIMSGHLPFLIPPPPWLRPGPDIEQQKTTTSPNKTIIDQNHIQNSSNNAVVNKKQCASNKKHVRPLENAAENMLKENENNIPLATGKRRRIGNIGHSSELTGKSQETTDNKTIKETNNMLGKSPHTLAPFDMYLNMMKGAAAYFDGEKLLGESSKDVKVPPKENQYQNISKSSNASQSNDSLNKNTLASQTKLESQLEPEDALDLSTMNKRSGSERSTPKMTNNNSHIKKHHNVARLPNRENVSNPSSQPSLDNSVKKRHAEKSLQSNEPPNFEQLPFFPFMSPNMIPSQMFSNNTIANKKYNVKQSNSSSASTSPSQDSRSHYMRELGSKESFTNVPPPPLPPNQLDAAKSSSPSTSSAFLSNMFGAGGILPFGGQMPPPPPYMMAAFDEYLKQQQAAAAGDGHSLLNLPPGLMPMFPPNPTLLMKGLQQSSPKEEPTSHHFPISMSTDVKTTTSNPTASTPKSKRNKDHTMMSSLQTNKTTTNNNNNTTTLEKSGINSTTPSSSELTTSSSTPIGASRSGKNFDENIMSNIMNSMPFMLPPGGPHPNFPFPGQGGPFWPMPSLSDIPPEFMAAMMQHSFPMNPSFNCSNPMSNDNTMNKTVSSELQKDSSSSLDTISKKVQSENNKNVKKEGGGINANSHNPFAESVNSLMVGGEFSGGLPYFPPPAALLHNMMMNNPSLMNELDTSAAMQNMMPFLFNNNHPAAGLMAPHPFSNNQMGDDDRFGCENQTTTQQVNNDNENNPSTPSGKLLEKIVRKIKKKGS